MKYCLLFATVLSLSCNNANNNVNEKLVVGKWQAISWVNALNQQVEQSQGIEFYFSNDKKYTYTNSGVIEKGTYKVENEMLFTTPDKQLEMMVKIVKATNDSLILKMERRGQEETLSLLKKE